MKKKKHRRRRRWILFTAGRFILSGRPSRSFITVLLSIFGLAAGIATLIAVISIMNGFQKDTIEDLIEINSFHLRIQPPFPDSPESLKDIPGISQAFPIIESQALLTGISRTSQAVILKAFEPEFLRENPEFAERIGLPHGPLLGDGTAIIGNELARFLGVERGDSIRAISLGGSEIALNKPVEISLTVSNFFRSGYYEFDRNWIFISLNTAEEDFQSAYRKEIAIKIDDRIKDLVVMQSILARYPEMDLENLQSWREFNRSIFGALRTEKTIMAFLIGLIFLVVGANISQGLRRAVHEHSEDIAILKTLGASERNLQIVFLLEGILIALAGTLIGLPLGLLISTGINEIFALVENIAAFIQNRGNFQIFSSSYFYLQEVPAYIIPGELLAIVLTASASAILSAYAASRRVISLKPREIFNND